MVAKRKRPASVILRAAQVPVTEIERPTVEVLKIRGQPEPLKAHPLARLTQDDKPFC
jgi:hypothetical protein